MGVLGVVGVVLEVPDLTSAKRFYADAGLRLEERDGRLLCRCEGQERVAITLLGGYARKRLHHLTLAVDPRSLRGLETAVPEHGGVLTGAPAGWPGDGLWLRDPHGMRIHLVEGPAEAELEPVDPFAINQPGRRVRANSSAMPPKASVGEIVPLRLGHVLLFTPDVMASIAFFEQALGMGLADRAQDIVAFMCSRHGSDHHVVAFAKSEGVGFHHASFQVATPDQVGVGGDRLVEKSGRGDWGFGRHTIGSNFFHYIQDPWGSWFEYYCDIDYVADYDAWSPTVYEMEDSLHHWGPRVPADFVHNYELDAEGFSPAEKAIALTEVE